MSDWIERTPRTERGEECKRSVEESAKYSKFAGTETYTEADNLLKFGDEENAKKIQAAHANVKATPGVSERNRLYNSPCGFLPIVPLSQGACFATHGRRAGSICARWEESSLWQA